MSGANNRFWGVVNASPLQVMVQWILEKNLKSVIPQYATGRLIDIGCGSKPYLGIFAPNTTLHIGIDHQRAANTESGPDILCSAYNIPVKTESFDCVLCTAVLEHLEEPRQALDECYRILRKDGKAIYSVPFIWHIHEEPRDFYRFSKYGLDYLFQKAGFEVMEIRALSGFWITFGQLLVYNLHRLNRGPFRWLRIIDSLGLLIQGGAYLLDRIDRTEQWTWMYLIVARKP